MPTRLQQIALAVVIGALMVYGGIHAIRAGGFGNFLDGPRDIPPTPSIEMSPTFTPTPTPVPARTTVAPRPATPTPAATVAKTPMPTPMPTVLDGINARRGEAGVGSLSTNAILAREAQEHAADMVARAFFNHTDPDGVTFQQRMAASGYTSSAIAENLGLTSGDATAVVGLWMQSQGHRENMLNGSYSAVGIGIARGTWQGQQATFVVAIFGATR